MARCSSWWYATARLQVTVLGIICWSKGGGRTYYTYASHCLDQSTPFALSCLADVLKRENAEGYSRQVVWADCGPHFRSSRFLAQVLVLAVQERPLLLTSELHFFAEGHGKGPCDAHFGRMARRRRGEAAAVGRRNERQSASFPLRSCLVPASFLPRSCLVLASFPPRSCLLPASFLPRSCLVPASFLPRSRLVLLLCLKRFRCISALQQ